MRSFMSSYKSDSKSTSTPSGKNGFKKENQKKGKGISHSHVPSDISLRVKALETVLTQKKSLTLKHWIKWWIVTKIRWVLKTARRL